MKTRTKHLYTSVELAVISGVMMVSGMVCMMFTYSGADDDRCPDPRLKSSADQTIMPTPMPAPTIKLP